MKKFYFIPALAMMFIAINLQAQKKQLTENQLLKGEKTNITTGLPQFLGWVDDTHFLLNKKVNADSPYKVFLVDCKTGKHQPSNADLLGKDEKETLSVSIKKDDIFLDEAGKPSRQVTNTAEAEINPTLSPDKNYIGFTRNNDLYTINIATGKEQRLTNDGSNLILNGYASWVYFEEILGRRSRYRSFWWSPDSKKICFMRMDDTQVPLFPIYGETGQHGYSENTRYPKRVMPTQQFA